MSVQMNLTVNGLWQFYCLNCIEAQWILKLIVYSIEISLFITNVTKYQVITNACWLPRKVSSSGSIPGLGTCFLDLKCFEICSKR